MTTYVCILSVNASGRYDPGLLFVLIQDEWISVDVATNDSKPSFVGNPLAISESRGSIWVARHDIESCGRIVGKAGFGGQGPPGAVGSYGDEAWTVVQKSKSDSGFVLDFFINFIYFQGFI